MKVNLFEPKTWINKSSAPVFKSSNSYYKYDHDLEMGSFTWLFRRDIGWRSSTEYEIKHFAKKDKVNIIQFAPSDGSESYTQIMSLLENSRGENVEKFFPIMAFDIHQPSVKIAKSGLINLKDSDFDRMLAHDISPVKYFKKLTIPSFFDKKTDTKMWHCDYMAAYKVSDELTKRVVFNQGDMFEIMPQIKDDSNTIIFCRNSLGYFKDEKIKSFIKSASKVLKSGSLFITGTMEKDGESIVEACLLNNGFKQVLRSVFKKV
jgi:chemotaxis methyl-accepting protein methylase